MAFPHHALHKVACKLRDDAQQGKCELRIPLASLLEAPGPLSDVANQFLTSFRTLQMSLNTAVQNGQSELREIENSLNPDEVVARYAQRDVLKIVAELEQASEITVLRDIEANFKMLRKLRPLVEFRGKDVVDLHLLAAIVHDRENDDKAAPGLLMSHNKKEFDPRKRAPLEKIYEDARLLWRDDFNLQSGVAMWNNRFSSQ